ncbi:hypothetical protein F889_03115 [Acinetobacter colistiniresistens]|uniref:Type IV pilin accessory protein n=1 Tax=Acinetobacter colistiniresistens TaxID=280145 RepID=N9QT06_9GAMM|nr:TfpX/TfpZ family type IV pilin accessory protein [Acinetobacter colistiniresistens]ENX33176.1 hypothetical protein F889_03115 [Acinetobacter colistiniresistens]
MSNRIKVALIHEGISIIVLSLFLSWVFCIWYPSPLAKAMGLIYLIVLIAFIHIVIAPLLTLFIYKDGKKTLVFDLSIIVVVQIVALCYGVWTIAQGRPAWIVYDLDSFEVVRPIDIEKSNSTAKNTNKYQQAFWLKPQYVAIQLNKEDDKEFTNDVLSMMFGGSRVLQQERYVSLEKLKTQIQKIAQSLELLDQYNDKVQVHKILAQYPQATAFVPLKANAVDMTILINKEKGEVVKIVDLRPWK